MSRFGSIPLGDMVDGQDNLQKKIDKLEQRINLQGSTIKSCADALQIQLESIAMLASNVQRLYEILAGEK